MKRMIVLLVLILALGVTLAEAQSSERETWQASATQISAGSATFYHYEQTGLASLTHEYEVLWQGTQPSSWTVTVQGCMRGGTCTAITLWGPSTPSLGQWAGSYDYYTIAIAWSGTPTGLTLNVSGSKYLLAPTALLERAEGSWGL